MVFMISYSLSKILLFDVIKLFKLQFKDEIKFACLIVVTFWILCVCDFDGIKYDFMRFFFFDMFSITDINKKHQSNTNNDQNVT